MQNSSIWIVLYKMRLPMIILIITYTISIIGLISIQGMDDQGNAYRLSIFDAFYFITYTASTIGFGETPYSFTYSQKIWVTFCIYFTVIAWFYAIGSFVSLFQNKLLLDEIAKLSFKWQINAIKDKFIIIFGFNDVTNEIIKRAIQANIRTVVIEENENQANILMLENYTPKVPILVSDQKEQQLLLNAGIKRPNCQAVVTLFDDNALNLTIAVKSKLMNKNIALAVKSSSVSHTENLKDNGATIIVNPFEIIAKELKMALNAPHLLKLEKWLYQIDTLTMHIPTLTRGRYLICGYGKLGKHIYQALKYEDVQLQFIERDETKKAELTMDEQQIVTFANADDKKVLIRLDIRNTDVILAFTDDDTLNLSIIATAKKLNPDILTMAREDNMDDFSIFSNAKIDYLFIPSKIMLNKTINALINPLSDIFMQCFLDQHEIWAQKLVKRLLVEVNENPLVKAVMINKVDSPTLFNALNESVTLSLEVLMRSLYNRNHTNNIVPLLLVRQGQNFLLPDKTLPLMIEDQLLFACDQNASEDIDYIVQNHYEFNYALRGEEKKLFKFKGIS